MPARPSRPFHIKFVTVNVQTLNMKTSVQQGMLVAGKGRVMRAQFEEMGVGDPLVPPRPPPSAPSIQGPESPTTQPAAAPLVDHDTVWLRLMYGTIDESMFGAVTSKLDVVSINPAMLPAGESGSSNGWSS